MPAENLNHKVFENTVEGAKACLSYLAQKQWLRSEFGKDFAKAKIHRDPSVEGVWAFDNEKTKVRVILYLAGYRDPWHKIREMNDFEEGTF
jgi:hypothetical protein